MTNTKKFNFISGLPRSGSTLLSTILNQNPRFTAGITDPLDEFVYGKIQAVAGNVGMSEVVDDTRLEDLIRSDFHEFYKNDNEVCFNTSRTWAAYTHLIKRLFPDFKMIVTIRSVPWILDSFERLHRKNPYKVKPLYDNLDLPTVYERTHMLMGNLNGLTGRVKSPLENVKQAAFSNEIDNILFIEYDALAKYPREVIDHVYKFLGEERFDHKFDDVEASYTEYDKDAKIEGLHNVRKEVSFEERPSILPPDLFEMYEREDFWKHESNPMRHCRFIRI